MPSHDDRLNQKLLRLAASASTEMIFGLSKFVCIDIFSLRGAVLA